MTRVLAAALLLVSCQIIGTQQLTAQASRCRVGAWVLSVRARVLEPADAVATDGGRHLYVVNTHALWLINLHSLRLARLYYFGKTVQPEVLARASGGKSLVVGATELTVTGNVAAAQSAAYIIKLSAAARVAHVTGRQLGPRTDLFHARVTAIHIGGRGTIAQVLLAGGDLFSLSLPSGRLIARTSLRTTSTAALATLGKNLLVTGANRGAVTVVNPRTGREIGQVAGTEDVDYLTAAPGLKAVLASSPTRGISVLMQRHGKIVAVKRFSQWAAGSLAYDPRDREALIALVAPEQMSAVALAVDSGEARFRVRSTSPRGAGAASSQVAYARGPHQFVVATSPTSLAFVNPRSGRVLQRVPVPGGGTISLLLPIGNGSQLAVLNNDMGWVSVVSRCEA